MGKEIDSLVEKRTKEILSYMDADSRTHIQTWINIQVEKKIESYDFKWKAINMIGMSTGIAIIIVGFILGFFYISKLDYGNQVKAQYEARMDKIEDRCIQQVVCDCLPAEIKTDNQIIIH